MGLDIIAQRLMFDRTKNKIHIGAERIDTPVSMGVFGLDPNKPKLAHDWGVLFGNRGDSYRAKFSDALEAIRRHNATYEKEGQKVSLPANSITAYRVQDRPWLNVTYFFNGKDAMCDMAEVRMLDGAKWLTFNIAVENGVAPFVEKAVTYLVNEELVERGPVPLPISQAGVKPRTPVIPKAILALNR